MRTTHGGDANKGKRKLARPIDPKRPMHLVLKAARAHGELSMLASVKRSRAIESLIRAKARVYGVRIYQYANGGNHLQLLLRPRSRKEFQDFLRVITGQIAQMVTGAKKGLAKGKFWSFLAFSRLMHWGKDFFETKYYVLRNALEADGRIIPNVRQRGSPATHEAPVKMREIGLPRAPSPTAKALYKQAVIKGIK